MLYLSLTFIALGVFFIIYTLLVKSKKDTVTSDLKSVTMPPETSPGSGNAGDNSIKASENTDRRANDESIINDYNFDSDSLLKEELSRIDAGRIDVVENIEDIKNIDEIGEIDEIDEGDDNICDINITEDNREEILPENSTAVLYEDNSNIIDYFNNNSRIDPTLEEYKKIKRIGSGDLEITEDGINFRTGKKFFKFEFHRIADIRSSDDYIVFLMKGNNVSRLLLFKKNSIFSTRLNHYYNNYTANVL